MNDEFNKNDDNEVVDSIPENARPVNEEEAPQNTNNNRSYYSNTTKVIIEDGPISNWVKVGFISSLLSLIFCCFPLWSFIFAFAGAGISLISIAYHKNGTGAAIVAIVISIISCVLATISGALWLIWNSLINLLF